MMPLTFSNTNCHAIAHFLEVGSYREIIVDNSVEVGSYRETRGQQFSIVGRKMVSRLKEVLIICLIRDNFKSSLK